MFIVAYGIWKSRGNQNIKGYLLSDKNSNWLTVGLSIMATQASAITFLSGPGQAYADGMRFVQFYFGLPLAMIILSITAVPLYHKLNVYTAYEFLEKRFDVKTRTLAAFLFLTQRGLAAGFTIFAPSLVLSSLMGWNIYYTNLVIGVIVVIYTVSGGSKAVNQTQKTQMTIILVGMFLAAYLLVKLLPENVGFSEALHIAGKMEKLNVIDFEFDLSNKYNIWSGMIGGLFLMLSYFGTDQSQVGRYLGGASIAQSRMGLLFNGLLKIPMQFLILLVGALLYVFYLFSAPPAFFNQVILNDAKNGNLKNEIVFAENEFNRAFTERKTAALDLADQLNSNNDLVIQQKAEILKSKDAETQAQRKNVIELIKKDNPKADTNDTNYVFFSFVHDFLPIGLLGLIISVIFSASMSSTSSELNALASTTTIDIYKRLFKKDESDEHYLSFSKTATIVWGLYAIGFSMFANKLGTLIEAVNILGSLVYGTILGIFLVAFYFKSIGAKAVFIAAILAELIVLYCFKFTEIPFLWFNVIGCLPVIAFSFIIQTFLNDSAEKSS